MDRFYIIANELKDIGYQITQEIQTYIEENGKKMHCGDKRCRGAYRSRNCAAGN